MAITVSLDSLGTSYRIPERGEVDFGGQTTSYLRDLAGVINALAPGALTGTGINVKDYGATGDGVTDDTAAIATARAVLELEGTSGGTLYFPAGVYKVTSVMQFGVSVAQGNVRLAGDGAGVSRIVQSGVFGSALIQFSDCPNWQVTDLELNGAAGVGASDLLLVDDSSYGAAARVYFASARRYGVSFTGTTAGCILLNCRFSGSATGNVYSTNEGIITTSIDGFWTQDQLTTRLALSSGTSAGLSASATARIRALSGELQGSQNGRSYRRFWWDRDVTEFGVVADGSTDDTAALQAALDWGYAEILAGRPARLLFPPGDMKITSTLLWRGNSASAPALIGALQSGGSYGPGSRFLWYGALAGRMFYAQSCNVGYMQDLQFLGRNLASCCAHFSATTFADESILAATNGIRVYRCKFAHCQIQTVGNAAVKIGTDPALTGGDTYQAADMRFDDCYFVGEDSGAPGFTMAGMKAAGVKMMAGGNCKLFSFNYCNWTTCNIALDATESGGPINVLIAEMGNVRQAFAHNAGHLNVLGGDIECSDVDDFRLISGTAGVGATANLVGLEVAAYMSGVIGKLFDGGGQLTVKDCYLRNANYSVSGDPLNPNPFKIVVDATPAPTNRASFKSENNWYFACGNDFPFIPVYDGSGNYCSPATGQYGAENQLVISSRADRGGIAGADFALGEYNGNQLTLFKLRMNSTVDFRHDSTASSGAAGNGQVLSVDATTGNKTITLPAAIAANSGRFYIIRKSDATTNTVTVSGVVLLAQNDAAEFISDGSAWVPIFQPNTFSADVVTVTTTPYTAAPTRKTYYHVDTAVGNIAFNLPAVGISTGRELHIKKTTGDAFTVIVTPASGTVDGDATKTIVDQYTSIHLICDGTNWFVH